MTMAEKFMIIYDGTKEKYHAAIWHEWRFLIDEKTFDKDCQFNNEPTIFFTDGSAVVWNKTNQAWELVG